MLDKARLKSYLRFMDIAQQRMSDANEARSFFLVSLCVFVSLAVLAIATPEVQRMAVFVAAMLSFFGIVIGIVGILLANSEAAAAIKQAKASLDEPEAD